MMKNMLLLVFLIFSFKAFAQFDDTVQSVKLERIARLEAGLHGIGVGLELPFSEKWSASLSTGLGGGYSVYAEHFQSTFIINQPVAFFKSEFKYTYNRSKRLSKSKSLLNNAGNYIAFQTKYTTRRVFGSNAWDEFNDPLNRTLLNEAHWGIQRPLGKKFIFNFHVGLGYAADLDYVDSQVYPSAGVQFAYVLSKKRF